MGVRRVPRADTEYAELVGTVDAVAVAMHLEVGWEVVSLEPDSGNVRGGGVSKEETILGWRHELRPRYPSGYEPVARP